MIVKIEIRPAIAQDFKTNETTLKIGQPFIILDEAGEYVIIHDYIREDLDLITFKNYLDQNRVFVPLYNYPIAQELNKNVEFSIQKYELHKQRNKNYDKPLQ